MIESGWTLPGPRRFAEDIAAALEQGQTAVLFVPDGFCDGLRGAVKRALVAEDWRFLEVDARDLSAERPLLEELSDRFALQTDPRIRLDIETFLRHQELQRRILFLDLRHVGVDETRRWNVFIEQHAAASRERRLTERLALCVVAGAPAADLLPEEDVSVRRMWWWARLSRLDAEVFVSDLLDGRPTDPVLTASIVEVAAFDLRLAELLVDEWQGELADLRALLQETGKRFSTIDPTLANGIPRSDERPPRQVLSLWASGAANKWSELDPCFHAAVASGLDTRELTTRVWRAQVRALLPEIEVERRRLAEWVLRHRRNLNDYWANSDLSGLEVGPLCKLVGETPALRSQDEQWKLIRWLRDARNSLAHWDVVDAAQLREGRQRIAAARTTD